MIRVCMCIPLRAQWNNTTRHDYPGPPQKMRRRRTADVPRRARGQGGGTQTHTHNPLAEQEITRSPPGAPSSVQFRQRQRLGLQAGSQGGCTGNTALKRSRNLQSPIARDALTLDDNNNTRSDYDQGRRAGKKSVPNANSRSRSKFGSSRPRADPPGAHSCGAPYCRRSCALESLREVSSLLGDSGWMRQAANCSASPQRGHPPTLLSNTSSHHPLETSALQLRWVLLAQARTPIGELLPAQLRVGQPSPASCVARGAQIGW